MVPFVAGSSSIASTVQTFCQLNQATTSLPTFAPLNKVSLVRRRAGSFTCKCSTETGGTGTEIPIKDEPPNPFASGKISSRVKVKKTPEPIDTPSEPEISSPFSTSSLPISGPFEDRVASPFEKPVKKKPAASSASGKISSRVKVRADGSPGKAFKAPPTVASPFDSSSPVPPAPTMNQRGITMIPEMDERVLESRKQILKELYGERRVDSGYNAAPADIFDEPKPLSPEEDKFKFDLIKGAEPYLLLISFSLITALMFGTAFVAYKLGAFHYNEL